jgi:hypothetical protein
MLLSLLGEALIYGFAAYRFHLLAFCAPWSSPFGRAGCDESIACCFEKRWASFSTAWCSSFFDFWSGATANYSPEQLADACVNQMGFVDGLDAPSRRHRNVPLW